MTDAVVYQFPRRRTCFACAHYDAEVAHCFLFDVPIDSEIFAAQDCHGFEAEQ